MTFTFNAGPAGLRRLLRGVGLALLGLTAVAQAEPELLLLSSGERLVGEVLPKSNEQTLYVKSALLGEVQIPRSSVIKMEPAALASATPDAKPEQKPIAEVAKATPAPAAKPASEEKVTSPKPVAPIEPGEAASASFAEMDEPLESSLFKKLWGLQTPESWNGNLRMGMNLSRGDSRWTETYARGKLDIRPNDGPSLYRLTGSYTYRETENKKGDKYKSQDKYDAAALYRRSFDNNNWFVQNTLAYRADQKKGIDREVSNLVGFGYTFKPLQAMELNVGATGGIEDYQTDFDDTRSGVNGVVSVFEEVAWRPFKDKKTSLVHSFNYFQNPEDSEQYNYVLKAAIRYRMTDLLGFEFSYNQDFDNDTGAGNTRDDTRWLNALIVYF